MKGTFILLALFFQNILTCYSQNQDSVFVFIGGTNKVLTRNNNMGLYFFKNIPNFETEFAEKHAIMFISDNVYLINDSGKTDIFSIYDSLIISNGRLLKESSCDYSDEDSIFCYILTNAICGEIDTNFMQNFLDTLNSFGISQVNINENRYNIVIPKDRNIITIINCINQLFFVQDVRFDQFFNIKLGTTDPLFSYQYYLSNPSNNFDINILPAWELTKGSSLINIGIWDDGVSDEHPDLDVNKIIQYPGSNFSTKFFSYQYNNDVSPYWIYDLNLYPWDNPNKPIPNKYLRATHGTAMAGIISADHNSIGIKGIAPFCKIAPIKMSFGNCVNQYPGIYDSHLNEIVQYIDDNTGNRFFDVVNCSWYFGFPYNGNSPLTKPKSYKAFENLIKNGRFGRGTTMVACTGNDSYGSSTHLSLQAPANLKINGLIAVGACTEQGYLCNYSNCGEGIDLVAIAGDQNNAFLYYGQNIISLDLPGIDGLNPTNITEKFSDFNQFRAFNGYSDPNSSFGLDYGNYIGFAGGTSSATAQVTGAIALLLSLNPCLKSTEIETILKRNAKKVNPTFYDYFIKPQEPGWSKQLGYGLLDIFQSLIDPVWDQNIIYSNPADVKAGTIYSGEFVTNSNPYGSVKIQTGGDLTYLAFHTIELFEGFEVNNGLFLAEIYMPDFPNCYNWDKAPMPVLGTIYTNYYADYNGQKISHTPLTNNDLYLANISKNTKFIDASNGEVKSKIRPIIFPNPNYLHKFQIHFGEPVKGFSFKIIDSFGQVVLDKNVSETCSEYYFNLNNVQSGCYSVILYLDENIQTIKLVIL